MANIYEIVKTVIIDEDTIEPTDSEGYEMTAAAKYNGKEYNIELYARCTDSYEIQAAKQITEKL